MSVSLDRVRELSERVSAARERANEAAVRAVRGLERRLVESLGDDVLRGLPNLTPGHRNTAFHGLRVSDAPSRDGPAEELPRDGRAVLAISNRGVLVLVRRTADGHEVSPAEDADVRADTLRPFIAAVQCAVEAYLTRAERRAAAYEEISALALRLDEAIGPRGVY